MPPRGPRTSGVAKTVLGKVIQERRLAAGWTLRRLSTELGLSPSHLSRVERGLHGPGDGAVALAAWLGLSAEDVLQAHARPSK